MVWLLSAASGVMLIGGTLCLVLAWGQARHGTPEGSARSGVLSSLGGGILSGGARLGSARARAGLFSGCHRGGNLACQR